MVSSDYSDLGAAGLHTCRTGGTDMCTNDHGLAVYILRWDFSFVQSWPFLRVQPTQNEPLNFACGGLGQRIMKFEGSRDICKVQ